jgi:hypothetical protein
MKPSKAAVLGLALFFLAGPAGRLAAQESAGPEAGGAAEAPAKPSATIGSGVDFGDENPFTVGSQLITIAAAGQTPLFTFGGDSSTTTANMYVGGSFTFGYQYFVARSLSIGGALSGSYNLSIGGLSLFTLPLTFKTAYWWSLLPFEFSVNAEVGGYMMRFDGKGMLGPIAKAGGGAYYRVSSGWSVGFEANYWFVPEIHTAPYANLTRFGNFLETGLTAVYHL